MSRRRFLILGGSTSSLVLLAACQQQARPRQRPLRPRPKRRWLSVRARRSARQWRVLGDVGPGSRPGSGGDCRRRRRGPPRRPLPSPAPKGKFVEAWHTSLSPAWCDPQENPPQITPYNFQLSDARRAGQAHAGQDLRAEPGRVVRGRAGLQVGDVQAPPEHQVPRRLAGHARGREVHLRELPRAPARRSSRTKTGADRRCRTTGRSSSSSRSRSSTSS